MAELDKWELLTCQMDLSILSKNKLFRFICSMRLVFAIKSEENEDNLVKVARVRTDRNDNNVAESNLSFAFTISLNLICSKM